MTSAPASESAPQDDVTRFSEDLCDLFLRRRSGHVDYWTYGSPQSTTDRVRGDEHWENFVLNHPHYYVLDGEAALTARFAADIARQCEPATSLVDLGPGSLRAIESKTLPFLSRLPKVSRYLVVDASTHFRQEAQRWASARGLSTMMSGEDFWLSLPRLSEPAVLLMAGGTISNLCPPEPAPPVTQMLARALRHFRGCLGGGGWLVFVYDSNQDEASLIKAYDHPSFHQFNFSVLHRAVRDLPVTDFDPDCFVPGLEWFARRREMRFFVETTRACSFAIAGQRITLGAGERFHLVSAYKYAMDTVADALAEAGWQSAVQYQVLGNPMVLCLAQAAPDGFRER